MARTSRPRILLFGSSNTDLCISCRQLPGPGETVVGGVFHESQGGKGANQAVAAARAGARVVFVGARGDDARGQSAARALKAGCQQVIITLGPNGVLFVNPKKTRHFPAKKCRPRDTVGAGDCFSGWLAAGLAEKMPVEDSIQRAQQAAGLSVTRHGAQQAMPRRSELV